MGALHYRCALPGFEETVGHPGEPGAAAAAAMLADAARRMLRGGGGGSGGGAVAGGGSQSEWDTGVFCKVGDAASCADLEGASCVVIKNSHATRPVPPLTLAQARPNNLGPTPNLSP